MADNYVQFSEVVPALNRREQAWVRRVLGAEGEDGAVERAAAGIVVDLEDPEDWPGFQWELPALRRGDLWLYAQENGNVQYVTQFVRAFLARFGRSIPGR